MDINDIQRVLKLARVALDGHTAPSWYPKHNLNFTVESVIENIEGHRVALAAVKIPHGTKEFVFNECWGFTGIPAREDKPESSLPLEVLRDMNPDLKEHVDHFYIPGGTISVRPATEEEKEMTRAIHKELGWTPKIPI